MTMTSGRPPLARSGRGVAAGRRSGAPTTWSLGLPGVAGNYATTPSKPSLAIVGDADIRVLAAPVSWTLVYVLMARADTSGGALSWFLRTTPTGLQYRWSTTGAALTGQADFTGTIPFPPGVAGWVKVEVDVDNGADGHTIRAYTARDGATWTPFGSPFVGSGVTSVFAGSAPLAIGAREVGASNPLNGKVLRADLRDGIGGTVVASPDFRRTAPTATRTPSSTTDEQGNVWTINGSAWDWAKVAV